MTAGRIAVIGDVHGHADELMDKLVRLGMDPDTLVLPEDLTVIQVGDLIHRGLQSSEVLRIVDTIMHRQEDQWIQLMGNHEAQYVHQKLFEWNEELPTEDADILRRWVAEGRMRAAAATVTPAGNEALITHAGLVYDVWKIVLGKPRTAKEAAARVNAGTTHLTPWLWAPGEMLQGTPNPLAGPIWASATSEVYPSWMNAEAMSVPAPFSQVHGHSSVYQWENRWHPGQLRKAAQSLGSPALVHEVGSRVNLNTTHRHTTTPIANATFIGVDPGHGRSATSRWAPLVYEGEAFAPAGETPASMAWLDED